jgi:hypothetical protein
MTHIDQLAVSGAPLRPHAVSLKETSRLLGDKAPSVIYALLAEGKLTALKDGRKTLVTIASIDAYMLNLPDWREAAEHKRVPPRKAKPKKRTRRVKGAA